MKILVTGGAGFIGSHTTVALLDAGYDVVVADNLCNSKPEALRRISAITGKNFEFRCIDLCREDELDSLFCEHKFDAVVHFAALKSVGESVEKPLDYYMNNLLCSMTLCRVMARHGCKKLVFSSSATVYGTVNNAPYSEDMSGDATNPYGRTKLMIEQMLCDLCVSDSEWSIALMRYFNPIGAHPSGLLGEDPQGVPSNIFPYIMQVAAGKRDCLNVFGNDYDTPDGTGVRDYIHVCDLAQGHLSAIEYIMKHRSAESFNLGTGRGISVLELVHCFEKACGKKIPYRIAPRRAGDVAASFADCSKAKRNLGWQAKYDIEDMCAHGWRFMQNNPDGYPDN